MSIKHHIPEAWNPSEEQKELLRKIEDLDELVKFFNDLGFTEEPPSYIMVEYAFGYMDKFWAIKK